MKVEIKNAIAEMLLDDATATDLSDTAEDFTWVFDYVKTNAEQHSADIQAYMGDASQNNITDKSQSSAFAISTSVYLNEMCSLHFRHFPPRIR